MARKNHLTREDVKVLTENVKESVEEFMSDMGFEETKDKIEDKVDIML